jgi:hypothetical protein
MRFSKIHHFFTPEKFQHIWISAMTGIYDALFNRDTRNDINLYKAGIVCKNYSDAERLNSFLIHASKVWQYSESFNDSAVISLSESIWKKYIEYCEQPNQTELFENQNIIELWQSTRDEQYYEPARKAFFKRYFKQAGFSEEKQKELLNKVL